ncbi:hypothetical protein SNEBB_005618 [Seison nebaliae]|nr:hypothetical protein SNEBB_005618 [Seison nebaliae]
MEDHVLNTVQKSAINTLGLILNYLFFGPDNVEDGETIGIIVEKESHPIMVRGPDFEISSGIFSNFFAYYIPINFMFISINTTEKDEKFYVFNKTIVEYMDSMKMRSFNDRFRGFSANMEYHLETLLNDYDLPKIVGISESFVGYTFSVQLSHSVICSLYNIFKKFYDAPEEITTISNKNGPTLTNERLDQIIMQNWNGVITVSGYRPQLPDDFWDREIPRNQDLFHGYYPSNYPNNYTPYAFEIASEGWVFKLDGPMEINAIFPENFFVWRQRRIDELLEKARKFRAQPLSDHDNNLIENRIREFITPIVHRETLALVYMYSINEESGLVEMTPEQFVTLDFIQIGRHALAIIKSFSDETWYVIDNDLVVKIQDLKSFIETPDFFIQTTFWYRENSYENDINELRPLVKPILKKHYL